MNLQNTCNRLCGVDTFGQYIYLILPDYLFKYLEYYFPTQDYESIMKVFVWFCV